jgi:hypothetical protein
MRWRRQRDDRARRGQGAGDAAADERADRARPEPSANGSERAPVAAAAGASGSTSSTLADAPVHIEDDARTGAAARALAGVLQPVGAVLTIGLIFVTVYLAAFHAPTPHHLPVAAVGTPQQMQALSKTLNHEMPDGFRVEPAISPAAARSDIEYRRAFGAVLQSTRTTTLLYAGANGPAVTTLVTSAVAGAAHAKQTAFTARDILPGAAGDTRGLSIFYAAFGLILCGALFGSVTYQVAPRLQLRQRILSLAVFAIAGGLLIALVAKAFSAIPGPYLMLAAVIALMAAAAGGISMTLVRYLGNAGISLGSVVLLVLGNSTGGGNLPTVFLPTWLHPLSQILPVGVGVRALDGIAYFHHDGLYTAIAVLTGWIALCTTALYARDLLDRQPVVEPTTDRAASARANVTPESPRARPADPIRQPHARNLTRDIATDP